MNKLKLKQLLLLTLALVGAVVLVRSWTHGNDAADPTLVFDRIWIDEVPRKPQETFNTFVASASEQPMGLFHAGSQWKGTYEVFSYKASGDRLRLVYLQDKQSETVKVRAWGCKERKMDYCLEISGASRGVKRYHSMDGWEIGAATRAGNLWRQ